MAFGMAKEEKQFALEWSYWRRRHQAIARDFHYRSQARKFYVQL